MLGMQASGLPLAVDPLVSLHVAADAELCIQFRSCCTLQLVLCCELHMGLPPFTSCLPRSLMSWLYSWQWTHLSICLSVWHAGPCCARALTA